MPVEQNARIALRLADRACVPEVGRGFALQGDAGTITNDPRVIKAYLGG